MDAEKKSPLALAVIGKMTKKKDEAPEAESEEGGNVGDEAELAAAEEIIEAARMKDASALRDALKSFMEACGY